MTWVRTTSRTLSIAIAVGILHAAAAPPPSPVESGSPAPAASAGAVNADGYTSAEVCGTCHREIYASWKNSLHAASLTDPIFEAAYMRAVTEEGDEARRICLGCHAPMTLANGDLALRRDVTREGVSCDFCHTVTAVDLERRERPYTIDPGPVKRSVLANAASPAHEVAYSPLHERAEFCGGCHNYVNAAGGTIMSTYDEWKAGPYATEGVPCQSCHMAQTPGRIVERPTSRRDGKIHRHSLIHDAEQLRGALALEIVRAERRGDAIEVDVAVDNVRSGHAVPTGMPTRQVVLTVTAVGGGYVRSAERRFGKTMSDAEGRVLVRDHEIFLHGAKVVEDTRVFPRERRIERFVFPSAAGAPIAVTAELSYRYTPAIVRVEPIRVELSQVERRVP